MPETITFHALDLSGETSLKLFLRKDDGSLLNAGGDALAEISSAGVFTATLEESRVGLGTLHARVCDGTETADNSVYEEFLPESVTVIGSAGDAVLNTETLDDIRSGLATSAQVAAITSQAINTVTRSVDDTNPLTFNWPISGATITATRSINNATYGAVAGTIAFLRTEGTKHYYTLAHNVADRPTTEGSVRYKLEDGTYTRYIVLRAEIAVIDSVTQSGFSDIFETYQITESYPSNNTEFTLSQALYLIYSTFGQFSINGTTITCKKIDGVTTSVEFDINSAVSPTSRVRSL